MLNIARFDKLVKDLMGTTGRKEKESILSQYKDAVIRRWQALSGFTGCKGRVAGRASQM